MVAGTIDQADETTNKFFHGDPRMPHKHRSPFVRIEKSDRENVDGS